MFSPTPFARKARQFQQLCKKVNEFLESGTFFRLPAKVRVRLARKLRSLFDALKGKINLAPMGKAIAGVAALLGLAGAAQAQYTPAFGPPVQNPFGIQPVLSYLNPPEFADLDNDGDLDFLTGHFDGRWLYYQNTGTSTNPAFAAPVTNPFNLTNTPDSLSNPAFVDIDADGDFDLFGGDQYNISFFLDTGTVSAPLFGARQTNPFGITIPAVTGYWLAPEFADMDNDGDYDLLMGRYDALSPGVLYYYQNTGDSANPAFAAPVANPFGISPANMILFHPEAVDLDQDGDFDILQGGYTGAGSFNFHQNTGSAGSPAFAAPVLNPFGLTNTQYYSFSAAADLDSDGDYDLLVGEFYANFQYFEDTNCVAKPSGFTSASSGLSVTFTNTSAADSVVYDFGDGNTSSIPNPVHTYAASGTYIACQIAYSGCGTDTLCDTLTLCVAPSAAFTSSQPADSVQFSDGSSGATGWAWDFGDGNTSTLQNPSHLYSAAGDYVVCLVAMNSCASDTTCDTVSVTCDLPAAGFTFSQSGNDATFTDGSSDATSWLWTFGDGNTSALQNPTHTYAGPGAYEVCLVATNSCGSDTTCDTLDVLAAIEPVVLSELRIFPNPNAGVFSIQGKSVEKGSMQLSVFDLRGTLVHSENWDAGTGSFRRMVHLGESAQGMYFVEIRINGHAIRRKVLVD